MLCAAGYSMGLLCTSIEKEAKNRGVDLLVVFRPYIEITDFSILKDFDAVVFAPQARHKMPSYKKKLEELNHNIPMMAVGFQEFGMADGKAVLDQILNLLKNKGGEKR